MVAVVAGFTAGATREGKAGDWPQFLGPNADGSSDESGWNQNWSEKRPRELWRAEVGTGCASVAVVGDRLFTMGNRRNRDVVWCLDVETGRELWSLGYDEKKAPKMYSGGPSATPLVVDGKVYTLSKSGKVHCLDADDGRVLWERHLEDDFGGEAPSWGYAASPRVSGRLLLLAPGARDASVVALDKDTGEEVWRGAGAEAGYAAPVMMGSGDNRMAFWFKADALSGHRLSDGRLVFRQPWKTSFDVNASRPLLVGNAFFVGSGYGSGVARVNVTRSGGELVWKQPDVQLQFQNAVHHEGFVYAISGDNRVRAELVCMDFTDGRIVWRQRLSGNRGNVLLVDDKLLALSEQGELILAEASPRRYRELGQVQVLPRTVWAVPAFSNGRLFARNNDGRLVAVDLSR